ncbi:hypothetical protein AY599_23030 [Leptolyngbya valderiana BDU 20041]|nr:hypothetical protein AY599_23030 [Leptolyngbya valderiana BDU 20041]
MVSECCAAGMLEYCAAEVLECCAAEGCAIAYCYRCCYRSRTARNCENGRETIDSDGRTTHRDCDRRYSV